MLMRFNSPDSLSPFGEGGLNVYAYCMGDPVNQNDPTGHKVAWPFGPGRQTFRARYPEQPLPNEMNGLTVEPLPWLQPAARTETRPIPTRPIRRFTEPTVVTEDTVLLTTNDWPPPQMTNGREIAPSVSHTQRFGTFYDNEQVSRRRLMSSGMLEPQVRVSNPVQYIASNPTQRSVRVTPTTNGRGSEAMEVDRLRRGT